MRHRNHNKMNQPNFFAAGSPFLQHPLLTAVRTTQEIDFILETVTLPAGGRILDIGCGFGRHSVELAKRGFAVAGIDPSAAMISAARQRAEEAGVRLNLQNIAAESFISDSLFDLALCLFTTLGQISATGENSQLVEQVYAALQPGRCFVVEVPQRETAVRLLKASDKFGEGERYTAVTRQYDPASKIVTERFNLVSPEQTQTYWLQYRLFSQDELATLLLSAGFTVIKMFSDYAGSPLTSDSPRMIMVGQK